VALNFISSAASAICSDLGVEPRHRRLVPVQDRADPVLVFGLREPLLAAAATSARMITLAANATIRNAC
jgi:hypothetical protein